MSTEMRMFCRWLFLGVVVSIGLLAPSSADAGQGAGPDTPESVLELLWSGLTRLVLRLLGGAKSQDPKDTEKAIETAEESNSVDEIDDEVWGASGN